MNPNQDLGSSKYTNQQSSRQGLLNDFEYDPTLKPANLSLAMIHGRAKRVYKYKPLSKHSRKCPCCGLAQEGEPLPLCCDIDELWHIGTGYSLFHLFYKDVLYLLLIMGIVNAGYSCYMFMNGNACDTTPNNYCINDFIGMWMISNIANNTEQLTIHLYIDAGTFVLLLIAFQIIRYRFRKYTQKADAALVTPSDFTIQISGLTKSKKKKLSHDHELAAYLESFSTPQLPIKVVKICRVFDIDNYVSLVEKRDELQTKIHVSKNPKQIEKLERQKQKYVERLSKLRAKGFKLTRVAFVTFEKAEQAYFLRKKFAMTRCTHHLNKLRYTKSLEMCRAPEPTDINWQYIGQNAYAKLCRRLFIFIITGLLILICFGFITLLTYYQYKVPFDTSQASFLEAQGYNLGISTIQAIMDPIICSIIALLAQYGGKYSTKTNYFISASQYTTTSKFINNVLTLLLGKMIFVDMGGVSPNVNKTLQRLNFQDVYQSTGVFYNMFITIAMNAFSQALSNWIGFPTIWKNWLQSRAKKQGKNNNLTQKEAQEVFEGIEYDLEDKYGYLISTFQMQCFFMGSLPMQTPLNILGLFINYWVDKLVLLKRSALPPNLGSKVQEELFFYFELSAFYLAFGDAFAYYAIWQQNSYTQNQIQVIILIVMNAVGIAILILPFGKLNEKLFPLNDAPTEQLTFHQARTHFVSEYELENPITRRAAIEELLALSNIDPQSPKGTHDAKSIQKLSTVQGTDFEAVDDFISDRNFNTNIKLKAGLGNYQEPTVFKMMPKKFTDIEMVSSLKPIPELADIKDGKRRSTRIGIETSQSLTSKFSAIPTPEDIEAFSQPKRAKKNFGLEGGKRLEAFKDENEDSTDSEDEE